jgi:hypothetical protein
LFFGSSGSQPIDEDDDTDEYNQKHSYHLPRKKYRVFLMEAKWHDREETFLLKIEKQNKEEEK